MAGCTLLTPGPGDGRQRPLEGVGLPPVDALRGGDGREQGSSAADADAEAVPLDHRADVGGHVFAFDDPDTEQVHGLRLDGVVEKPEHLGFFLDGEAAEDAAHHLDVVVLSETDGCHPVLAVDDVVAAAGTMRDGDGSEGVVVQFERDALDSASVE